ncbi:MAG TPA: cation-translocating P-type ATPase [Steroidobacteraceae bacterium]|nr:cation-translocating P-type ATPase [Steroidobacteraceae bacterium]
MSDSAQHAFYSGADDAAHAVFSVEGMRCAACSRSVSRAIGDLPGVARVSVNVATQRAVVDWDPGKTTLPQICAAVAAAGFKVAPLEGAAASSRRRAERRAALKRIGLAGLGMMQTMMFVYCLYAGGSHGIDSGIAQYLKVAGMLIATPVLWYSGAPFFRGAWSDLRRRALGMDVPVALALALAYGASVINTLRGTGEIYFDSVTMFIFFLLAGRFVELAVRQRNLSATEALARSLPASVARLEADGSTRRVAPEQVRAGDRLWIPKGAVVPVDAGLIEAEARVQESLLTGESSAILKRAGATVLGGSVNVGHAIKVEALRPVEDSMLAHIVRLLERTQAERPTMARGADRIAAWFVLVTVALALGVAVLWWWIEPARALPAALAVLVVTCPCALSLATPAAFAAATTRLAKSGLLVTRPDALERLARADLVVLDKTGTLTSGAPVVQVTSTHSGLSRADALQIAAALEFVSDHPIATAFRPFVSPDRVAVAIREFAGKGVEGTVDGRLWRLGRADFVAQLGGDRPDDSAGGVLGSAAGVAATFAISDGLRDGAKNAVSQLRELGLQVVIASGDDPKVARDVGRQLDVQEAYGHLKPEEKLAFVRRREEAGARVLMVGDGINDGPVLAAASVSCALADGSAIAQAAADLLLLNESLTTLAQSIRTARQMRGVIRQNLTWSLLYNLAAVPLAAAGWIAPWVAAIGMSTSSLLVVLNAARLARPQASVPARRRRLPGPKSFLAEVHP